jgi:hypothetical protein
MSNSETTFLNVDLDLVSRSNLQPLVSALGRRIFPLYVGRIRRKYEVHLELSRAPKNPDEAIRHFAGLIRSLPNDERKLWDTARIRDFNIGVQAGMRPHAYKLSLSPETIETISILRARIVVILYAPDNATRRSQATRKS